MSGLPTTVDPNTLCRAGVPWEGHHNLFAAYDTRISHHRDPAVRLKAAHDWCQWEDAIISLDDEPYRGSRAERR
jgi:proline iminopeptidase